MFNFIRTIRFRLTLWFLVILAVITTIIGILLYVGLQQLLYLNLDSGIMAMAERSVDVAQSDAQLKQFTRDQLMQRVTQLGSSPMRLIDLDGRVISTDTLFPAVPVLVDALESARVGQSRCESFEISPALPNEDNAYRICTRPVRVNGVRIAVVQIAQSLQRDLQTLANLRQLMLYLLPVTLFFSAIAGYVLAGRALSPAERVRRNVEHLISDQVELSTLNQSVAKNLQADEIGRLAQTFDDLLSRLRKTVEHERQFAMDVSHELRSPLTALKGEISVALSRIRSADDYHDILVQLEASVDDMSLLVEDLLTIARASATESPMGLAERIDISDLVVQVCDRLQVVADDKAIQLGIPKTPPTIFVKGNRQKLQRVFTNLLDNALRYTPSGGCVSVHVRVDRMMAIIEFVDTGIGIPKENLGRIFDRFYRTDAARARESGGTGLGLAIVKAVVSAHGGQVQVTSRPNFGSTFTVQLPLDRA